MTVLGSSRIWVNNTDALNEYGTILIPLKRASAEFMDLRSDKVQDQELSQSSVLIILFAVVSAGAIGISAYFFLCRKQKEVKFEMNS